MKRRKGRKRALGTRLPLPKPDSLNQVWSLDFLSDALSDGRRFRILGVMDQCSRECLTLAADTSLSGERVARELDDLVSRFVRPLCIISDNGTMLWLLFCKNVQSPADPENQPLEAMYYYASRVVQWEVGNGGFGQAVENVFEWMRYALAGFEGLNEHKGAALIRTALEIVSKNQHKIEDMFDALELFDEQYNPAVWNIDEIRIAYVRTHREAFSKIHWANQLKETT